MVEKVAKRLPGWQRRFLTYPGRELLVKTVLLAISTHFLTIFKMPQKTIKRIDQFRRSFIWKGNGPQHVKGGTALLIGRLACYLKNMEAWESRT
jgi:hypothetical protein